MTTTRTRSRAGATPPQQFFGLAVECEPRGQVQGKSPGIFTAPTTDTFIHDDIYECGRFKKGANWTLYKTAAVARGANPAHFVEDATYVRVTNSAVEPFLSLFDIVIVNPFQNGGYPPIDIKAVKTLAAQYGVAQRGMLTARPPHFLHHGWKDDMPAGPHTSTLWSHYYDAIKANNFFMQGAANATNGKTTVDPEETLSWPGGVVKSIFDDPPTETPFGEVSGHNWHVDYTKANFASTMAETARLQFVNYWSAHGGAGEPIDSYMVHDIVPRYPARDGTATNLPAVNQTTWYNETRKIPLEYSKKLSTYSPTLGRLWTTYGGGWGAPGSSIPNLVDTVGGIFFNFMWARVISLARFEFDVRSTIDAGIPFILGNNLTVAEHLGMLTSASDQTMAQYIARARELDWARNMYMASCNEIGYLYWQPGMRLP